MDCPKCVKRGGKTWQGSRPTCGFSVGEFSASNWNCAALNNLRRAIDDIGDAAWADDQSCTVLPLDCGRFLVVAWYKNRGRAENCIVIDGLRTRPAVFADIELATRLADAAEVG